MFTAIRHFTAAWTHESGSTAKVLAALTEPSLTQRITEGRRSLGELAWHVVVSPRHMLKKVALDFPGPNRDDPAPSLKDLRREHGAAARALAHALAQSWTDEALREKVEFYGMTVPRGVVLAVMLFHEIHHRGQMIVLMRQAGLDVPKVYG